MNIHGNTCLGVNAGFVVFFNNLKQPVYENKTILPFLRKYFIGNKND